MDEAIRTFMLDREFQPMQASTTLGGRGELQVPDCDDIYRPALESAVALLSKLGVKPEFRSFKDAGYTLENCQSWLRETSGEVTRLTTKRNSAVSLANDDRELIGRLEPFSLLEVNLEELLGMKSMRIHFGSTLIEYWDDLRREAETEYGAFLFRSGFEAASGEKMEQKSRAECIARSDRTDDMGRAGRGVDGVACVPDFASSRTESQNHSIEPESLRKGFGMRFDVEESSDDFELFIVEFCKVRHGEGLL